MALQQMPLAGMQEFEKPREQSILWMAVQQGASIDVVERLAALQQQEREYQANVAFDEAKNYCQQQIGRIAPNQKRNDTGSQWADYAALDKVLRPIYTAAGFSISFEQVPPITAGKIGIRGTLSRGGISRSNYYTEITPSTTGPKGGVMATATDADAIAASRAKRYVLLDMWNIAVGIDKEEKQGIPEGGEGLTQEKYASLLEKIQGAANQQELQKVFLFALGEAGIAGDSAAVGSFNKAKNEWFRQNAGGAK